MPTALQLYIKQRTISRRARSICVEAGASMDVAQDTRGWVPLHCASDRRCCEVVVALLKKQARVWERDWEGRSPLHFTGLPTTLARLVAGASVNAIDDNGNTALHLAAGRGHQEVSRLLVQAGAYVDATNSKGCTALHDAVSTVSDAVTVRLLIEAVATVDARDDDGRTPLHRCAFKDNGLCAMAVLLERGADVKAQDPNGNSPLHWAVNNFVGQDIADNVDLLLRWGADETVINHGGRTPFEEAVLMFDIEDLGRLADLLVQAPVDRNWRRRGWLLAYRAYPRRMRPIPGAGAEPSDQTKKYRVRSLSTEAEDGASVVRKGAPGGVARAKGAAPGHWNGVVTWVVELELEGVFRNVVMYL